MIGSMKEEMAQELLRIYPDSTIYDEDIPQGFETPCFLITVVGQEYYKGIRKNTSEISFDLAYFSDKPATDIKNDCLAVQQELFRGFDLLSKYRCYSKSAEITDNVLHFLFKIKYSEIKVADEKEVPMTNLELSSVTMKE